MQPDGMVTVCETVSVSALPLPLNHASQEPACGGSPLVLLVIGLNPRVEAPVQPPPVPLSKPGLVSSCAAVQPPPPEVGLTVSV